MHFKQRKQCQRFDSRRVLLAVLILFGILYSANREAESSNARQNELSSGTFDLSPVDLGWTYEWAQKHNVLRIKPYPGYVSVDG